MIKMETFEIDSIPTGLLKNSDWYYNKIPPYNHKNYSLEFLLPFNIASQGGMITYPRIRKDGRLMYRWSKYKSGDHYQHMAFRTMNYHNPFVGDSALIEKYSGDLILLNLKEETERTLPIGKATFHDASLREELFLASTEETIHLLDESGNGAYEYKNERGKWPANTMCFWHSEEGHFFTCNNRFSTADRFLELRIYSLERPEPLQTYDLMYLIQDSLDKNSDYVTFHCLYDEVENILYLSFKAMNKRFADKTVGVKIRIE